MRLTHQASEAQDLVQEALMKAWANWHRYQPGGSLGAWLSRILVNTFISRHRHQRVVDVTAARSDLLGHLFDGGRLDEASDPEQVWHGQGLSDEVLTALAGLALTLNTMLLLPIIGALFVVETLSVIIQVFSFRVFGRRVFRMAPIHHHYELRGWPETTVIVRFWMIAGLATALALGIFYADFTTLPALPTFGP